MSCGDKRVRELKLWRILLEAKTVAKDNGTINHFRSAVFSNQPLSGLLLFPFLGFLSLVLTHLSLQLNVNYLTAISCIENVIEIQSHPLPRNFAVVFPAILIRFHVGIQPKGENGGKMFYGFRTFKCQTVSPNKEIN